MSRVTSSVPRHKKRKRLFHNVEGYRGSRSKLFRTAKESQTRAGTYAYRDRKVRKRDFRKLWIIRINAACRQRDLSYSLFIHGLKKAGIEMDRKCLSEVAIQDPAGFEKLVEQAKAQLTS